MILRRLWNQPERTEANVERIVLHNRHVRSGVFELLHIAELDRGVTAKDGNHTNHQDKTRCNGAHHETSLRVCRVANPAWFADCDLIRQVTTGPARILGGVWSCFLYLLAQFGLVGQLGGPLAMAFSLGRMFFRAALGELITK